MNYRKEKDSIGYIDVPADKYWGAQTQRSFQNFKIGGHLMPVEIIRAFAILKKAAAITNLEAGYFPKKNRTLSERSVMKFSKANWTISSRWWFGKPDRVPNPT